MACQSRHSRLATDTADIHEPSRVVYCDSCRHSPGEAAEIVDLPTRPDRSMDVAQSFPLMSAPVVLRVRRTCRDLAANDMFLRRIK
jgi:hypothetical protein